ncbi:recombinase family protein [Synechococcus sp. CS-1325]|uniref:recombinase family protein n=1 Tax=Synechococcus sp. CS-1325 TaxID=2847979 RepID=UPI000DB59AAE|nr:recombinase family protein [Synechococcus sp. CS-1325]MCT0198402.1 recombinase family protein [Synechococcus sp. CS-1325]PZU97002.1 MAG: recombinase [Cyanobium sp.]
MTTANPPVTGKGTQRSVTPSEGSGRSLQLVAYYRVSTDRQGRSGLGLDAQRQKIHQLAAERGAVLVAEFTEVESGRKADRPQLALALAEARKLKAAVAVAKLDRLARDAELVLRLSREAEANGLRGFLFADLPDVDATTSAGRLILAVMASVAEFEARRISERTKEAMAQAAGRGVQFGAHRPQVAAANHARREQASTAAERLRGILAPMAQAGASLRAMAAALNAAGVATASGGTSWSPVQVSRAIKRLELTQR